MGLSLSHPGIGPRGGARKHRAVYRWRSSYCMQARKKETEPSDGKELMITMIRLPCWIASLAGTIGGLDSGLVICI